MVALSTLALFVSTAFAAIPPALDPFYTPPAGFQSTAPGTILAHRTFIPSFLGLIPDPVLGYQLLYRTTAINGSAIAGVTSIFVPANATKDRFISFQTAYDSSSSICDPSYEYQLLSVQADLLSSAEMLILQGFLLGGYIVSSPDYEGPDAAFTAGRLSGMGTLDSMRAVSNFHSTLGLSSSTPQIVGNGYSGGAIATGWAASLASSYAPELPVKGWAMGGTPANLTGTAMYIDGTPFSGFLPAAVDGLNKPSAYHATINPILQSILTPYGQSVIAFANANCVPLDILNFFQKSIQSTTVQSLGPGIFYHPSLYPILVNQTMGVFPSEHPLAPVHLYHATNDEIIPYANASTLFTAWCNDGSSVHFTTLANGAHISTEILGFSDAYTFVGQAFAGTVPKGCSATTTLSNPADPVAGIAALEPLLVKLLEVLDATGTNDEQVKKNVGLINSTSIATPSS